MKRVFGGNVDALLAIFFRNLSPLRALAADYDDASADGGQQLKIPISVLPYDAEAIVVQQRRKLLREGVAQRDARDLGVLLLALVPASVGRPVQDLSDMVVSPCFRQAHLASAAVDEGRPIFFLLVDLEVSKLPFSRLGVGEERVARLEGK